MCDIGVCCNFLGFWEFQVHVFRHSPIEGGDGGITSPRQKFHGIGWLEDDGFFLEQFLRGFKQVAYFQRFGLLNIFPVLLFVMFFFGGKFSRDLSCRVPFG